MKKIIANIVYVSLVIIGLVAFVTMIILMMVDLFKNPMHYALFFMAMGLFILFVPRIINFLSKNKTI